MGALARPPSSTTDQLPGLLWERGRYEQELEVAFLLLRVTHLELRTETQVPL